MSGPRVAIVTGGGSGIGLAISQRLAADGCAVAVLDLHAESATAAAQAIVETGGKSIGLRADVGDRQEVLAAVDEVRRRLGSAAILVNNAGTGATFKGFLKITPEAWERALQVNLTGAFHCCQAVLPDMIDAGWGRIVNISSSSAHSGQPLLSPYVSSKVGAQRPHQVPRPRGRHPGASRSTPSRPASSTPRCCGRPKAGVSLAEGGVADAIARTPVRRAGLPEDVAATCSFLCRDEAGYITGQIIGVNGGRNT